MTILFCLLACNGTKSDLSDDGIASDDNDSSHSSNDTDGQDSGTTGSQDSGDISDTAGETGDTGQNGPSYPFRWDGVLTIETGSCSATVRETGVEFTQDANGIQLLENNPCPECDEIYYIEDVEPLNACDVQFVEPIIRGVSRSQTGFEVFQLDSQDGFVPLASATGDFSSWSYSFEVDGISIDAEVTFSWD